MKTYPVSIGAMDREQDFFENKMWLKVRPHWYLHPIHTAQIALLYCLKLPVCKPTNGDALRKALNGRAVMAKKNIYKHN